MPRFPDESVACLKRFMLSRASHSFKFTPDDIGIIRAETGLNQAQVQVWAENFRMRYVTVTDKMDFLQYDGFDKVA